MKLLKTLLILIRGILLWPLLTMLPRNRRKIVFGAWKGLQFSDNPKYFMLYLLSNTNMKCYWVGDESLRTQVEAVPGAVFLRKGSCIALWHFLTARYLVCNVAFHEDISSAQMCGRVCRINLWHGTPLKKIGDAQLNGAGSVNNNVRAGVLALLSMINILVRRIVFPMQAFTSSSSCHMKQVFCDCFKSVFAKNRVFEYGSPRIDYLVQNANNETLKKSVRDTISARLGIPCAQRWYLYLPTWRHGEGEDFSFSKSNNKDEILRILDEQDAVLIEKQHPKVLERMGCEGIREGRVISLGENESIGLDIQELLLASDCLITDYSSCFFDFETMNRPVIHFAYDYEDYVSKDSGCYYNLSDIAAGPIASSEEELMLYMRMSDQEMLDKKGPGSSSLIAFEKGHSSERLAESLGMK